MSRSAREEDKLARNPSELGRILNETRAQGYAGHANWDHIRQLKQTLTIPVIGNGDVTSVAAAHRMLEQTGCDAVMIGRGALGNPWIFRDAQGWCSPLLSPPGEAECTKCPVCPATDRQRRRAACSASTRC